MRSNCITMRFISYATKQNKMRRFNTKNISKNLIRYVKSPISYKYGYIAGGLLLAGGTGLYLYARPVNYDDVNQLDILVYNRIKSTYGYILGGLVTTAITSMALFKTKLPQLIMRTNPMMYIGISLAASIPMLIGTMATDYNSNLVTKHVMWLGFNCAIASNLCIFGMFGGPLIAQAALATGCVVGGLSLIALNAKPGSMEKFGAPLGIGLGIVVAAGLGYVLFPISLLHSISLYGGLAVFSGLTLTNTQKLIQNAEDSHEYDPINESLGIYLDIVNIFIRMVQILHGKGNNNNY